MGSAGQKNPKKRIMNNNTNILIPARLSTGLKKTAHIVNDRDECDKWTTDKNENKNKNILRLRNNAVIGTWNVRTLNRIGSIQELETEMKRYRWKILGLCETRWKYNGNHITDDGHQF